MPGRETADVGYIVHRRRLRETSYVVQTLTRAHGLMTLVARGRAGQVGRRRDALVEFCAVHLAWSGRSDMPTLIRCEAQEPPCALLGDRLFSGLYLNELVINFVPRGDSEPGAFDAYDIALHGLATGAPLEATLRAFEVALLDAAGYGMGLEATSDTGHAVAEDRTYYYVPERGVVQDAPSVPHCEVSGGTLLALSGRYTWTRPRAREAKHLMRTVIRHHLGGRELAARSLFKYSQSDASES